MFVDINLFPSLSYRIRFPVPRLWTKPLPASKTAPRGSPKQRSCGHLRYAGAVQADPVSCLLISCLEHHFGMMMSGFPTISDGTFSMSTAYDLCVLEQLPSFDWNNFCLCCASNAWPPTCGKYHTISHNTFQKQTVTCLLSELCDASVYNAYTCSNMITMRPGLCEYGVSLYIYPQSNTNSSCFAAWFFKGNTYCLWNFNPFIRVAPLFESLLLRSDPMKNIVLTELGNQKHTMVLARDNLMALVDDDEAPSWWLMLFFAKASS